MPGQSGSPRDDAGQRLALLLARDGDQHQPGAGDAGEGEGHPRVGVATGRVLVHHDEPAGVGVEAGRAREERGGVAVGAEAEVDHVEAAELAEPQLVRVGALVAEHRVVGVDRADLLEQGVAGEVVVGLGESWGTQRSSPQ